MFSIVTHGRIGSLLAGVLVLVACRHVDPPHVSVDDYLASLPSKPGYVIEVGDLLAVQVWTQESMSFRLRVRSDGMITLPLVGDVRAKGTTPMALAETLRTRLKDFLKTPVVTVGLEEARALTVSVIGEVARPGHLTLEHGAGVWQALAVAGGLTDFADRDRIFVLRPGPPAVRILFSYRELDIAGGPAATFKLQPGDVVVVE